MASETVLTLTVRREGEFLKQADFTEQSITIGRGEAALFPVSDDALSDLHAVINVEDDGSVMLLDLGSETGTHFDGERISNAQLQTGDRFDVGPLTFEITLETAGDFDVEAVTQVTAPARSAAEAEAEQPSVPTAEPDASEEPVAASNDAVNVDSVVFEEDDQEVDDAAEQTEDVMAFVMRSGQGSSPMGLNLNRPKVLEVQQLWGEQVLDTKHFSHVGQSISIGARTGFKWHFLGVDMGWVPSPLNQILRFTPPMWSEVHSDWKNDFYAPDDNLPQGIDHELFRFDEEQGYIAQVANTWDGFVDIGEDRYTFEDLVEAGKATRNGNQIDIPMQDDARLMIDVGGVIFFSQKTAAGWKYLDRRTEDPNYPLIGMTSFLGFLAVCFAVYVQFYATLSSADSNEIPDRFVELMIEKPEEEPKEKKKPAANPDAGEGAKAKKKEGKTGKKDAKMKKAKGNKVEVSKKIQDRKIAENAGILGALRDSGDLSGMGGLAGEMRGGIGGLIGAKGTQIGSGGLGSRGSGLGGGGSAEGIGGLGTKGMGSGRSGYGTGGGSFGEKGEGGLGAVRGDPMILGALDRSLIDAVIKRNMNQIKYCYQKELNKNPSLAGKITIKFTIAKDGSVSQASKKASTMGNPAVESCIVSRFMRMKFPQPQGGGIVIVSYPFIFSS